MELFRDLAIALGLGLLVGLQREWVHKRVAGIRTFALIALFGALCGVLARTPGLGWVVAAGLAGVAGMFWVGERAQRERRRRGITTEVAGLAVYVMGVLVMLGQRELAIVSCGVVAVLLAWKRPLHHLVRRIGPEDLNAILRLVIVGMVILPLLPDRAYGPFGVLNPFRIWLMVVLIVGISLAAYTAERLLQARSGTLLAGLLGGLISSTATTVGYARRSRGHPAECPAAAAVLVVASTVVFARVVLEVAVVSPALLPHVAPPLLLMMLVMAGLGVASFRGWGAHSDLPVHAGPPADLRAAVVFGLLYGAVLFGVAAVKQGFGNAGMYTVAGLSGLTDVDAITLSTSQLMQNDTVAVGTGWRLILVGAIANLVFKGAVVAVLGHRLLTRRVVVLFGLGVAAGLGILLLWPG